MSVDADGRWRYDDPAWKELVRDKIAAAGGVCQIRGPKCVIEADCGDHIIPVDAGGALLDPDNVRAACTPCNSWRGNTLRGIIKVATASARAGRWTTDPGPSREW